MQIESFKYPGFCIDSQQKLENLGLEKCYSGSKEVPFSQNYLYTINHEIRGGKHFWYCWDIYQTEIDKPNTLNLEDCNLAGEFQNYTFNPVGI